MWWQFKLDVPPQHSELLAYLLAERWGPVELRDLETLERSGEETLTELILGFDERPPGLEAEVEKLLSVLGFSGLSIFSRQEDDESWREGWRAFLKTQPLSPRLWVQPLSAEAPPEGQRALIIEAGMAFGTGDHLSTQTTMTLLDDLLKDRPPSKILDVGTGSGILSIAVCLLGHQAVALENDPEATDNTRRNMKLNGVSFELLEESIESYQGAARAIVVVNMEAPKLIKYAPFIQSKVGEFLILGGLLQHQVSSVLEAYPKLNLTVRLEERGWCALRLQR